MRNKEESNTHPEVDHICQRRKTAKNSRKREKGEGHFGGKKKEFLCPKRTTQLPDAGQTRENQNNTHEGKKGKIR